MTVLSSTTLIFYFFSITWLLSMSSVPVHAVSCPINANQTVNITRISNSSASIWFKTNDGGAITNAKYNSKTGVCLLPSNDANYTIYCEEYDNNKYKFTLQVHQPIEGDVYYIYDDVNDKTTITFQDPVKIEPELKDNITLTDEIQLKTSITCTQLTPVFTWIIKSQNGNEATIIGRTTTDTTGCDVNKTTTTSTVTISKDTVEIFNDPFTVSVQLSYRECDNIYISQPTPYFTIKDKDVTTESSTPTLDLSSTTETIIDKDVTTESSTPTLDLSSTTETIITSHFKDKDITTESSTPTLDLSSTTVPASLPLWFYIEIGVGGAVVVIIIIIICCCWKRKEKKGETESREDIANLYDYSYFLRSSSSPVRPKQ